MPPESLAPSPLDRAEVARRLGRRLGLVVFGVLVSTFTIVCSLQIIRQVWFPDVLPFAPSCRAGIRELIAAVERARRAAAAENGDETAALARFRAQLEPQWRNWRAVEHACAEDREAVRALREVVQLRYAEEHAVRYEAVDLARLRRRVYALDPGLRESRDPR